MSMTMGSATTNIPASMKASIAKGIAKSTTAMMVRIVHFEPWLGLDFPSWRASSLPGLLANCGIAKPARKGMGGSLRAIAQAY